jgi:hypothetical protein
VIVARNAPLVAHNEGSAADETEQTMSLRMTHTPNNAIQVCWLIQLPFTVHPSTVLRW